MITTVTAKLKLLTTPEQVQAFRATQLAYRDALNYVSRFAFAHGMLSNTVALQEGTYQEIRSRFGLPAQLTCSVSRQVGATYQALWTRVKANAAARATPKRLGSPRNTPTLAPVEVRMRLLGPGVMAATNANRKKAMACSAVMAQTPPYPADREVSRYDWQS
jgi:predicted transposase